MPLFFKNWSIVDLQCCVRFRCTKCLLNLPTLLRIYHHLLQPVPATIIIQWSANSSPRVPSSPPRGPGSTRDLFDMPIPLHHLSTRSPQYLPWVSGLKQLPSCTPAAEAPPSSPAWTCTCTTSLCCSRTASFPHKTSLPSTLRWWHRPENSPSSLGTLRMSLLKASPP